MQRRRERLANFDQRLTTGRATIVRTERVRLRHCRERLTEMAARSARALKSLSERRTERVNTLGSLLNSLGYKAVLARGYALVRDGEGHPLRSATAVAPGQALAIEFADGTVKANADGAIKTGGDASSKTEAGKRKRKATGAVQGSLFER